MTEQARRQRFQELVASRFAFLETDRGFERGERGRGAENSVRYQKQGLTIDLTFAYPELPFLVVSGNTDGTKRYRFVPTKHKEADALRRRYYRAVERGSKLDVLELAASYLDLQKGAVEDAVESLDAGQPPGSPWSKVTRAQRR